VIIDVGGEGWGELKGTRAVLTDAVLVGRGDAGCTTEDGMIEVDSAAAAGMEGPADAIGIPEGPANAEGTEGPANAEANAEGIPEGPANAEGMEGAEETAVVSRL